MHDQVHGVLHVHFDKRFPLTWVGGGGSKADIIFCVFPCLTSESTPHPWGGVHSEAETGFHLGVASDLTSLIQKPCVFVFSLVFNLVVEPLPGWGDGSKAKLTKFNILFFFPCLTSESTPPWGGPLRGGNWFPPRSRL